MVKLDKNMKRNQKDNNEDCIVSPEEVKQYVKDYKSAQIAIKEKSDKLDLHSFAIKVKGKYLYRIIAVNHCDGSYLEFHAACFEKFSNDWFFVFTEHHGDHIYHKDDVSSIMEWAKTRVREPNAKILYVNRD